MHLHAYLQIALVAYQQLVDVLAGVSVDLMQPLLNILKAVSVCHIVHYNDAVCSAVVCITGSTMYTHIC
jgi:hypothetical protein